MCFSAEADFVSGAMIGTIGVATLAKVKYPREIPLAALPLAFATHQVIEGFVWRDVEVHTGSVSTPPVHLYLAFAWVVLPVLVPLAMLLVEPKGSRRRYAMTLLVGVGVLATVLLAQPLVSGEVSAHAVGHSLRYEDSGSDAYAGTILYVLATCGAPLLSSHRAIFWLGVANLFAVAAVVAIQEEGLTSVWCTWAALVSVLILVQFTWWRRAEAPSEVSSGAYGSTR